jgi:TM2 domain-containing membrane protein YozV
MSQAANPAATVAAPLTPDHRPCGQCGAQILKIAEICPKCGVRQRSPVSKALLLLLTFFFGGLGGHKFYLGKYWQGALYLIFFWTGIPALIALVEFIVYLFTGSERLNEKYSANGSAVLAVVIAVVLMVPMIGILAAVAIPAYSDFQHRARVVNATVLAVPWSLAVESYYKAQGKLPDSVSDLQSDTVPTEASNKNASVSMGAQGVLTLTMSPSSGYVAGKTFIYRPTAGRDGTVSWDCTDGTLEPRYRIARCRAQR